MAGLQVNDRERTERGLAAIEGRGGFADPRALRQVAADIVADITRDPEACSSDRQLAFEAAQSIVALAEQVEGRDVARGKREGAA